MEYAAGKVELEPYHKQALGTNEESTYVKFQMAILPNRVPMLPNGHLSGRLFPRPTMRSRNEHTRTKGKDDPLAPLGR